MGALAARAESDGISTMELASRLGIGYVYLMQLLRGKRPASSLGRDALVAAAEYLNVPVAEAFLLAGVLEPTDFVQSSAFREVQGGAYEKMLTHPLWGAYVLPKKEWERLPEKSRLFLMFAFEQVTKTKLIDDKDRAHLGARVPEQKPAAKKPVKTKSA